LAIRPNLQSSSARFSTDLDREWELKRDIPRCTRGIFCRFTTTQKESCPRIVISYGFFSAGNPRVSFYRSNGKTFHSVTTNTWKLHNRHKGSSIYFFFFLVSRKLKLSFVKISTLSVWSRPLFRETVYIYSQDDRVARLTQFRFFSFASGGCQLWIPFSPGLVLPVFSSSTFAVKKICHFALQPMSRHRYLSFE